MIELRNVSKIYKSKKSTSTTALDKINLKIGNKGMLFIVGKSGSGKSTLLNLLGGLDSVTTGEILVNNKNISKFNKKQYDSYRNTYIGFIFQEFNVLEEYNVYENIEIALKLQNKKSDKIKIDNLLNKLGIENLGKRKINELSGGQKQRVAIARALIKNPKIILADEPTGNLDRASSEQIFNILKEISKDQLVIVVSHDMESAIKYADRIVRVEDGKIISDSNQNVILEEEKFELKKSKLPFFYALKMALTSFKVKPFRLFMTILLTTISLIFMGFTVNGSLFDENQLIIKTMKDNNSYNYNINKLKLGKMGEYGAIDLDDNDITYLKNITNSKLNYSYTLYNKGEQLLFEFGENKNNNGYYDNYLNDLSYVELEDNRLLGKIIGQAPVKNNEIVVHKYFADYIIKFGIKKSDNKFYYPKNYQEIVDSKTSLKLGRNNVIITGIIDDDDSLFKKAKEKNSFENEKLENYFSSTYSNNGNTIYVKGFIKNAILEIDKNAILNKMHLEDYKNNYVNNFASLNKKTKIITNNGIKYITSLNKEETVISIDSIRELDEKFDTKFNEYLKNNNGEYSIQLEKFCIKYLKDKFNNNFNLIIYDGNVNRTRVKALGITLDSNNYVSNDYIKEYVPVTKKLDLIKIYDDNINNLKNTFSKLKFMGSIDEKTEPGIYYTYNIPMDYNMDISNAIGTYKALTIYILIVSLIFVIFTLLLFSNFISLSISYCKKEIGILRALGATRKDIIKIFGYESLIIGIISWILSSIGLYYICNLINNSMYKNLYFNLDRIVIHPFIIPIMFIYTIMIAILITSASIGKIVKVKPIDAILNK